MKLLKTPGENFSQMGISGERAAAALAARHWITLEWGMPLVSEGRKQELHQKLAGLPGRVVVISGPSAGAGKGKVIRDLLQIAGPRFWLSVSMTTRQVRGDDKPHHTYMFVTREEFDQVEQRGEMLEANGVTEGNRYGTPLAPIVEHLTSGETVLLEIEVRGAEFVRQLLPGALLVFIKPTAGGVEDDIVELRRRLEGRGTNDSASVERRLAQAEGELKLAKELGIYDAFIVNARGESEQAAREILDLINKR